MTRNLLYSIATVLLLLVASCEEVRNEPNDISSLEGEWKVEENSEYLKTAEDTYNVYITFSREDSTTIYISNFYHLGYDNEITGNVEENRIELPSGQEMDILQSVYVVLSGVGNIATDYQSINWEYEIDDGSGLVDHVTATYTRVSK